MEKLHLQTAVLEPNVATTAAKLNTLGKAVFIMFKDFKTMLLSFLSETRALSAKYCLATSNSTIDGIFLCRLLNGRRAKRSRKIGDFLERAHLRGRAIDFHYSAVLFHLK